MSEVLCRRAEIRQKRYYLSDGNGLILQVTPNGKKYWIARTWQGKKEKRKHLGSYPEMSLKRAREANILYRKAPEETQGKGSAVTFEALTEDWLKRRMEGSSSAGHLKTITLRLEKYILPALGQRDVNSITPSDVLAVCRVAEDAGFLETAHRLRGIIGQIFRYGVACDICQSDPSGVLRGAIRPYKEVPYPTLTDKGQIRALVKGVDAYPFPVMRLALWFSLLTFARPGEVRHAEWSEIGEGEWVIPAEKMKMRRMHVVPISPQLAGVIDQLRSLTGKQRWLFPSARTKDRPMSEAGVRTALRAIGFSKGELTAHSFRSIASTVLNENGWEPDVIERQLAHEDANKTRAAYNRSEYMEKRREMMQWWGEWIDEQK